MKSFKTAIMAAMIFCVMHAACSRALITAPVAASNTGWEITVTALRSGPDQYNTANGYWEPRKGMRFVWASVRIYNRLKTGQEFLLEKIVLTAGGKAIRPFILDMGGPVSVRANPAPVCAPGESIARNIIYIVPKGAQPETMTYEKTDIPLTAGTARR